MSLFVKRREEDHEIPKPADASSRPSGHPGSASANAAPLPARPAAPSVQHTGTSIGRTVAVKGEIQSQEDLLIDGRLEGTLDLGGNRLVVGPNGNLRAGIAAKEVDVHGTVNGNIQAAERIILRKNSTMIGDLKMTSVVIEDGAYFKGSIDITRARESGSAAPGAGGAVGAPSSSVNRSV